MTQPNTAAQANKIAIVTGGSRGLGRSTVLALAKRGVDSIITYHSNRAEADRVVDQVREAGRKAISLQLDTGNVRTFDAFVQGVRTALAQFKADRFDYLARRDVIDRGDDRSSDGRKGRYCRCFGCPRR